MWTEIKGVSPQRKIEDIAVTITSIVSLWSATAVSSKGNIVSSPGNPAGGFSDNFSSAVWGAEGVRLVTSLQQCEELRE